MTTNAPDDAKPGSRAPADKNAPSTPRPGTANKPAGQPAQKGPLDKPRTA